MKLSDAIKSLQAIERELGGDADCVAFTLEHGPFELSFSTVPEDEDNHPHVAFGPDTESNEDWENKIYKD